MSTALKNEIKKLARESVREALQEELTLLRILHLPLVSKKEQQNINKLYKAPSRRAVRSVYVRA
ncbi:MAG: hypothetical protein NUV90_00120 [Candidatus Parcubacteria bacterium]|nr:hypothetical protein [Candidatus Parcubacteria bacterium]